VRGFPLVRALIVSFSIITAAFALFKLTKNNASNVNIEKQRNISQIIEVIPFSLKLSSEAQYIKISDEKKQLLFEKSDAKFSEINEKLTHLPNSIHIEISWLDSKAPHYFAKLSLEPKNKETLNHIFDSSSNINDIWELQ
jgi:hypothetical protein